MRSILVSAPAPDVDVFSMLFLLSYVFLLRVPSEALPVVSSSIGVGDGLLTNDEHSRLACDGKTLTLVLAQRKNKPFGSRLERSCWCRKCKLTCPVHVLGRWINSLPHASKPFARISPKRATDELRRRLQAQGCADAAAHVLKNFRRGHALDLLESGAKLAEILRAGEWKSPAFLLYLDMTTLEKGAVMEAHLDESEDDAE